MEQQRAEIDAPVAVAGPDSGNGEGGAATFDAFGSYDVDGDNLTYFWEIVRIVSRWRQVVAMKQLVY